MQEQPWKKTQSGRTMLEMMAVLAIMGVLSAVAVLGLHLALNKSKANTIVHDARIVYMESVARQGEVTPNEWTVPQYQSESGRSFSMMRDVNGNDYVKVIEIEKEICTQMMNLRKEGELTFLTETLRPFEECIENNPMIFGWDGIGQLIPCETTADCQEGEEAYNGYCDTEIGYCHPCAALELLSSDRTACVCDTSKAVSCSDNEGNSWCCGDTTGSSNLICGSTAGSCVPNTDGKCNYYLTRNVQDKTLCHYTLSRTVENKPLCHYTFNLNLETHEASFTEVQGCTAGFCYLKFRNTSCAGAGNDTTDLYGLCQPSMEPAPYDWSCTSAEITSFTEVQGCTAGFCYLKFRNTSCAGAGDDTTDLYGLCQPSMEPTPYDWSCTSAEITAFTENIGCPVGQYCSIKWRNNSCTTASDKQTGTLYGACIPMDSNSANCPY